MRVEEVFVTEGVPRDTFIEPPNYNEILVDIRSPSKPVILEGQSGTGKTTAIKKILEREAALAGATYLTPRIADDLNRIEQIAINPRPGILLIDDFHRLARDIQTRLADLAKVSAEEGGARALPKLVLIGINQVGSGLIQLVPDLAKRFGIHKVAPATEPQTLELIRRGAAKLNVGFENPNSVYVESAGDYWLTQLICQTACVANAVLETVPGIPATVPINVADVRKRLVSRLHATYSPAVKEFCRGRRFRPSNDPYFKLLRAVAESNSSSVDLTMLANSRHEIRASIINIKDARLRILLESKPAVGRYFYYNQSTANFAIEDPALFYYLKHLDWEQLRLDCGFRHANDPEFEYDLAISFAGEHRDLARYVAERFVELDVSVFFDEYFENNFLGKTWTAAFKRIFGTASRYVVCFLDQNHLRKIWPTFERDCFEPRVPDGAVIPIFLDDSVFPGIPKDIVRIDFRYKVTDADWQDRAQTEIAYRIIDKLGE